MSDLVSNAPSISVGDYVKAVWEVTGSGVASTKEVAERLSVSPASVTNMFVRLQEMGFVEYERYRGASLTRRGREEALRLIRRHRLIETFLLEHLGYSWREVHEEAERLEHAVSDGFTERLAEFLGHPDQDPHGDPIPAADGSFAPDDSFPWARRRPVSGFASPRWETTPRCSNTSGSTGSSPVASLASERCASSTASSS
jgi:DtxR family transcriptional regulator, Mn-dependent transcriptional regulator